MGIQFKYMHCPSCIMERKSHKNRLKEKADKKLKLRHQLGSTIQFILIFSILNLLFIIQKIILI